MPHVDVNMGVQQMHSSVLETEVWHMHGTGGLFQMSCSEGSAIPAGNHMGTINFGRLTPSLSTADNCV